MAVGRHALLQISVFDVCLPFGILCQSKGMGELSDCHTEQNWSQPSENKTAVQCVDLQIGLFNHVSYVDAFVLVGLMGCSGQHTAAV